MPSQGRQLADELGSDRSEEPRGLAAVAFAPLEEEAGAKMSPSSEVVGHGARNRRLASASRALQPEYSSALRVVGPFINLTEEVNASAAMASRLVLFGMRVERGLGSER
jgi:hypothetical protein